MIEIDDKIVSLDLLRECFACDLSRCKGICCVEGNAGAPLEIEEVATLEAQYETYKPYMTPEGIAAVERQGFMVVDDEGDYTTPLVGDAECAYSYTENGVTVEEPEQKNPYPRRTVLVPQADLVPPLSDPRRALLERYAGPQLSPLGGLPARGGVRPPAGHPRLQGPSGADRAAFQRRVLPGARSVPARTGAKTLILIQRN